MREIVKKGGRQEQTKVNKHRREGQPETQSDNTNRPEYIGKYGFFQGKEWDKEM